MRTIVGLLPTSEVVVYAASMRGDAAYDATVAFPVLRDPARTLLPTAKVTAGVVDALQAYGCDRVLLGGAAPLGLLAPALREAGARRVIAITHTPECWWARLPAARQGLRRIGDSVDVLTYLGAPARSVIAPALSPTAASRMRRFAPGVDPAIFRPGRRGAEVRRRYGIGTGDPVIVCIAPLDHRFDQALLVSSMPRVLADVPNARLLVVGAGRQGPSLAALARSLGVADRVVLTGAVPWAETPPYLAAGDVCVLPTRTRPVGLVPEPVDTVVLEAQATELPVIVVSSDDWTDRVLADRTGFLVGEGDRDAMTDRLLELLGDPVRARATGRAGRAWIERAWAWEHVRSQLVALLEG